MGTSGGWAPGRGVRNRKRETADRQHACEQKVIILGGLCSLLQAWGAGHTCWKCYIFDVCPCSFVSSFAGGFGCGLLLPKSRSVRDTTWEDLPCWILHSHALLCVGTSTARAAACIWRLWIWATLDYCILCPILPSPQSSILCLSCSLARMS